MNILIKLLKCTSTIYITDLLPQAVYMPKSS